MKTCKTCKDKKKDIEFPKHSRQCQACFKESNRRRSAEYNVRKNAAICEKKRIRYALHRKLAFEHYGKSCACCGERESMFLTIDHINNDGYLHRQNKISTSHHNVYGWIVRNDFPEGFQVLCMNCNTGKHRNGGVCPHKLSKCNDQRNLEDRAKRLEAVGTQSVFG